MKLLIVGNRGQVGTNLMNLSNDFGFTAVGYDLPEIDITDPDSVSKIFNDEKPDLVINAAAFTGVIYLVKNKNIYFISSVLLLSLSVLAIGGLGFAVIQKGRHVGIIVKNHTSVKKIPLIEGETIVEIKSGESVLVNGDSENFLFVYTGTGIKGWIDKSDLMVIKD